MTDQDALSLAWDQYRREFERCWPWLEAALRRDPIPGYDKEHLWDVLAKNGATLWPSPDAAIVTHVVTYPTGVKSLHWWLTGGSLAGVRALIPAIEAWAKSQGCSVATCAGRKGWLRAVPGYRIATHNFVKDL